ncbi:hypothetical protein BJP36_41010 [Moorena producens JHB]|uniref:Uncharacterized protein n=1 Tax=Moorena producens (strain JHB) TaxID=1454205 RepID=A0A9Q9UVE8_MOOP1|nr:hypothetical protein [Moorena producens]WAN68748.1 hypothetical protein BJP36_41010 [Moorena producens JHB]
MGEYVLALLLKFLKICRIFSQNFHRLPTHLPLFPSWSGLGVGSDYRLPITDYRLPITDYRLPITDYLLPITYYLLPISKVKNLPLSGRESGVGNR